MATHDRIGIGGHAGTCEVAGALMLSGTKRKVEELGGHVASAVVGGVVDWSMSAAVARYESRTSVDDQLDCLRTLSIKVHSAVEAAEGVHIRSWWLRRWLWRLRDAALEGDEVLQLFRQRRAAEETDAANKQAAGNMVWRALGSVKSLLFGSDDGGVEQLSRMVARLEREAMGLGDFLKMLELEIRDKVVISSSMKCMMVERPDRYEARVSVDEQLERLDMLLIMVRQQQQHIQLVLGNLAALILRAAGRLIRKPPAPPPPPPASRTMIRDAGELHDMVARIQRAVQDARDVKLRGKRSWLDKWRSELQAVASRADRVLLTLPVKVTPDGIHIVDDDDVGEEVWRMAQIVEAVAAHLEDFVTLVRQRLRTGGPPVTDCRRYLCAVCQL